VFSKSFFKKLGNQKIKKSKNWGIKKIKKFCRANFSAIFIYFPSIFILNAAKSLLYDATLLVITSFLLLGHFISGSRESNR